MRIASLESIGDELLEQHKSEIAKFSDAGPKEECHQFDQPDDSGDVFHWMFAEPLQVPRMTDVEFRELNFSNKRLDWHLDQLIVLDRRQLFHKMQIRLPQELRDEVYGWLVGSSGVKIFSDIEMNKLPTINSPLSDMEEIFKGPIPWWDREFLGEAILEDFLMAWYRQSMFVLEYPYNIMEQFLSFQPFQSNLEMKDIIRHVLCKVGAYFAPELTNKTRDAREGPLCESISKLERIFDSPAKAKVELLFQFKADGNRWDRETKLETMEDVLETIWPTLTKAAEKRYTIKLRLQHWTFPLSDIAALSPNACVEAFDIMRKPVRETTSLV